MSSLFQTIREQVTEGRYVIGQHAVERLDERGILEWQVVAGVERATLIAERPDAEPNPAIEMRQTLPDGTEIKVVWALLRVSQYAKLVTVHFVE